MPFQLLARDLAEVVQALQDLSATAAGEKRRYTRMTVNGVVRLVPARRAPEAGGPPLRAYSALARDVSFQGLGWLQGMPASKGEQYVVHLPRPNGRAPLVVICTVMHCRALADGIYAIGSEFADPASLNGNGAAGTGSAAGAAGNAGAADAIRSETDRIRASIFS